jgi:preprotein translocase subunit SecB
MSPPIQMLDYVVDHFHVDVNRAYREDTERVRELIGQDKSGINLEVDWSQPRPPSEVEVGAGEKKSSVEIFPVNLTIYVNDQEEFEESNLYRIRLRLAGLFQRSVRTALAEDNADCPTEEDYMRHTLSSCISMLYGAARNVISSTTSQSPYEKLLLPPVSPMGIAVRVVEGQDSGGQNPDI